MGYVDYYLVFESKEQFNSVWQEGWIKTGHEGGVFEGGIFYQGGEYGEDGEIIVAPVAKEGWHVNVWLRDDIELPSALEGYVISTPAYPKVSRTV